MVTPRKVTPRKTRNISRYTSLFVSKAVIVYSALKLIALGVSLSIHLEASLSGSKGVT